jgi:hypothetical protein
MIDKLLAALFAVPLGLIMFVIIVVLCVLSK